MSLPNPRHFALIFLLAVSGCSKEEPTQTTETPFVLFERRTPAFTGIEFANMLSEHHTPQRNVLLFEYFSNGSGIAAGDVNGDGLDDLYFTGNMSYNALYLNKGNLSFEDITSTAGVAGRVNTWKTGVTMADVNGDGLLDIYVCYSGDLPLDRRVDELYINTGNDPNGIPVFEERAADFGLANPHSSNQAHFFDYDRDGDLDLFLLTHNVKNLPLLGAEETRKAVEVDDPVSGVRFYRNDNNFFVDITIQAGISSSVFTYGLGAGVSDFNNDGWIDIYVGNDYSPPDYLYLNQADGTFKDALKDRMQHTSYASMGIDVADINNDGWTDIFVLDMLAEGGERQKTQFMIENRGVFKKNVASGFNYQYTRNTLQLNQGNGYFAEVGQLSGVSNTDWSWAPLIADFDNDGLKDIFITNGVLHNSIDRDFIDYKRGYVRARNENLEPEDIIHLMQVMPDADLYNYMFVNEGGLKFKDVSNAWGIGDGLISTGAVYSDLDRDGDLDLVTANINEYAIVHENRSDTQDANFLQIELKGGDGNSQGIGARVVLYTEGDQQLLEQMPVRGYLSSVSPVLHFGLGDVSTIDSLTVTWPTGEVEHAFQVAANQRLFFQQKNASALQRTPSQNSISLLAQLASSIPFEHQVPGTIDDYERQPLIVNPKSVLGPALTKGDVNGDGLDDLFLGGGIGQASELFIQRTDGSFLRSRQPAFIASAESQDVDALFFDSNGDGAPDLYVASGGYGGYNLDDASLQDRLYINNGEGLFTLANNALPEMRTSTSSVTALDINKDGAADLFVGGYVAPGRYPESPRSYILMNDGKGTFSDGTTGVAPDVVHAGMITDSESADMDGDGSLELVLAGEWMPIRIYSIRDGKLDDVTASYFSLPSSGFWNTLYLHDVNKDGRMDVFAGNLGLNTQIKVSKDEPAELYFDDFNNDGTVDPLLTYYVDGVPHPFPTLEALEQQLPAIAMQFPNHRSYGSAKVSDIIPPELLSQANRLSAQLLETSFFLSGEDGRLELRPLPIEAQFAPVHAFLVADIDGDSIDDILMGGNVGDGSVRHGKHDASNGMLLSGKDNGLFEYVPPQVSGFNASGEIRKMIRIGDYVVVARRGEALEMYSIPSE